MHKTLLSKLRLNNTKIILRHNGVPSAPFTVIRYSNWHAQKEVLLEYPIFVKPVTEGSSKGIDGFNKANNFNELELAIKKLSTKFPDQDLLLESFLAGRELTVSILGTGPDSRVIGIREHIFENSTENGCSDLEDFASWRSKLSKERLLRYNDIHDMADPQIKAASQVALDAWVALGCRDAGRVDIRFDSEDCDAKPNVLEVSACLPELVGIKLTIGTPR